MWLMYHERDVEKNRWFIDTFIGKAKDVGSEAELVTVEEFEDTCDNIHELPDIAVARMIRPDISEKLENMGIRVCNDSYVSKLCNNKLRTIEAVHKLGVKHIPAIGVKRKTGDSHRLFSYYDSTIDYVKYTKCKTTIHSLSEMELCGILDRKTDAKKIIKTIGDSFIIKSVTGHGGTEVMTLKQYYDDKNVVLGSREPAATDYYRNDECIIQPFIDSGRDLRVYVIGNKIIGTVLRQSVGDFRANYSLGGKVLSYELSDRQKEIVYNILKLHRFDYAGIDFLLYGEDDQMMFNEIEDVVGARMLSSCTDIDYIKLYLSHLLG